MIRPIFFLLLSNLFMTIAWYGHLKHLNQKPLWIAIMVSWGIAFVEYCFQVPANREGYLFFNLAQLKIIQEVIALSVFAVFAHFYMEEKLSWNFFMASLCMLGAVYFIFKDGAKGVSG